MSKPLFLGLIVSLSMGGLHAVRAAENLLLLDRIVAVVEDDAIMNSELEERIAMVKRRLSGHQGVEPPPELLKKQVLEHLIIERLQLQLASRQEIRIDDLTLDEAMRALARRNHLSLEKFHEQLVAENIDYVKFREQVRTELALDTLRKRVVDRKIQVTDQEVNDLIATQQGGGDDSSVEYRLNHILIAVPEGASADRIQAARTKAESIRERVLKGVDFKRLAISESDGQKALEGGDLDWRKSDQLPSLFARRVPGMKVGDISEVIRSPSGFHLIYLADRRGQEQKIVNQTRARHILVKTSALINDEQARLRLKELAHRIELGESFAELAKAHSEDAATAIKGGDLGWVNPGELTPEFEDVMNSLQIHQLSEPFKSGFGWHLVQIIDRREYDNTEQAMRAQARETILRRRMEEETELWLRRLRDESYVEYRLEPKEGT
jgi:peptidyl-prolyl cis-trans isomerase SurA